MMKWKEGQIFTKSGVNIGDRGIQACHRLRVESRSIAKFANRKGCLQVLRAKMKLRYLDPVQ